MRQMQGLLLITTLVLSVVPVIAQTDLDESYEWDEEGITVDYPDDWDAFEDENDFTHFQSDETDIIIVFENYDPDDDIEPYIEAAFDEFKFDRSARFDEDDVFIDDLEDFDLAASYFYTDEFDNEEFEAAIIAIPLDDEVIAIAIIVPITDDEIDELDIALEILATLTIEGSSGSSNDEVYEFDNGYEIVIEDWDEDDELFSNDDLDVIFYFMDVDDERVDTRSNAVREIFADISNEDYDEDNIQFIELDNDVDAIAYVYEDDYYVIIIAFSIDDDTVVGAVAIPSDEDDSEAVLDYSEDFYLFIETLD